MLSNPESKILIFRTVLIIALFLLVSYYLFFLGNFFVLAPGNGSALRILPESKYIASTPFHYQVQEFIVENRGRAETSWRELFVLEWGENPPAVGGKGYDPGEGKGISGGAIPTDIWVDDQGDILLADGYGPRLQRFKEDGTLRTFYDWKLLRPDHFHILPALCGYRMAIDILGRWHILDQEKQKIYCYDQTGKWIKTWSIKDLLKDQYTVHDVHPVLQVAGKDLFYLQLTVSSPLDITFHALDHIPVQPSRLIALWIDACKGLLEEVSPDISLISYGYHTWQIESPNGNEWSILQKQRMEDEWISDKRWVFKDIPYRGGDLIGLDRNGRIYWWADIDQVSCLNTITHTLDLLGLPDKRIYHPVAIHPLGGLLLLDARDFDLSFFRMQFLPD